MNYFISDIKKMYRNLIIRILFFFLLVIMILDPISVYLINHGFLIELGRNPFQFWLLINSVSWGNAVYYMLFWVFPILTTGLIFFSEKNSSMFKFSIVRNSRLKYMLAKVTGTFVFSFVFYLMVLSVNLLATYTVFRGNTEFTEYFTYLIPKEGTFVYGIFQVSPFLMAITYTILNAFVIAIFSVFAQSIHMIFNFKNQYIAIVVPIIILYGITFVFDSTANLTQYNISMIVQPRAVSALTTIITKINTLSTVAVWVLIDMILVAIGIVRNRDVL